MLLILGQRFENFEDLSKSVICVQKLIPTILTYTEELGKPPPEDDERNNKGHSKRLCIVLPVITFAIGLLGKGVSGEEDRKNRG